MSGPSLKPFAELTPAETASTWLWVVSVLGSWEGGWPLCDYPFRLERAYDALWYCHDKSVGDVADVGPMLPALWATQDFPAASEPWDVACRLMVNTYRLHAPPARLDAWTTHSDDPVGGGIRLVVFDTGADPIPTAEGDARTVYKMLLRHNGTMWKVLQVGADRPPHPVWPPKPPLIVDLAGWP